MLRKPNLNNGTSQRTELKSERKIKIEEECFCAMNYYPYFFFFNIYLPFVFIAFSSFSYILFALSNIFFQHYKEKSRLRRSLKFNISFFMCYELLHTFFSLILLLFSKRSYLLHSHNLLIFFV